MGTAHKIPLSSDEIEIIWNQYILDTMSICMEKFALATVQDKEIHQLIQDSVELLEKKWNKLGLYFKTRESQYRSVSLMKM
ncbi:MAG: hypothetical protein H6Q67_402 [Firmicutes bacterium]|nr:hypothetical protein [Bacillota bacterium]